MEDRTKAVREEYFRNEVLGASRDKLTKFIGKTITPNLLVVLVGEVTDAVADALARRQYQAPTRKELKMDARLKTFIEASGLFHVATHEPVDDEWHGDIVEHLVRAVEPDSGSDDPRLEVVDELAEAEVYRIEIAIPWTDIEGQDDPNPSAVALRIIDALLIRFAADLSGLADSLPGEGNTAAIERIVKVKAMNGFSTKEPARNGTDLLLRFLVRAGKVDR